MPARNVQVLGVCGSLRAASINAALLRALRRLAPAGVRVSVTDVGRLPLFNPDLEARLPPEVGAWHAAVTDADALVIASPEYAHGVSGPMKNALDWLVSFPPFAGKPVAVLNASPRAQLADAALREILTTMAARLVPQASISLPLLGTNLSDAAMAAEPGIAAQLAAVLTALRAAI